MHKNLIYLGTTLFSIFLFKSVYAAEAEANLIDGIRIWTSSTQQRYTEQSGDDKKALLLPDVSGAYLGTNGNIVLPDGVTKKMLRAALDRQATFLTETGDYILSPGNSTKSINIEASDCVKWVAQYEQELTCLFWMNLPLSCVFLEQSLVILLPDSTFDALYYLQKNRDSKILTSTSAVYTFERLVSEIVGFANSEFDGGCFLSAVRNIIFEKQSNSMKYCSIL